MWLLTGQKLKIKNLKSKLVKGIKYYNFVFYLKLFRKDYYHFLDFLIFTHLTAINKTLFKKNFSNNNVQYSLSDFSNFANIRLSNLMFLSSIDNTLYIEFINLKNNKLLDKYCSLLKI